MVSAIALTAARSSHAQQHQSAAPANEVDLDAGVEIPHVPFGFSKLVIRLDKHDEIGVAGADFSVMILEHMRARGFDAVGAENLVFGKDESRRAEYMVGGTLREGACKDKLRTVSCRVGVEWQVLDVVRDRVVYSVLSRAVVLDTPAEEKDRIAGRLVERAVDSLLRRDGFRRAHASHEGERDREKDSSPFADATIARCAPGRRVADNADDLLHKVVVIKGLDGFGSGFFVSPEGLIMTAAHVVRGRRPTVRLREGEELEVVPVRVASREDVALLRTAKPLSGQVCVPIRKDIPTSGAEVYAAGAPASLELAFSLTRGIVSGFPVIDGRRRLQTDASVNPGNSGGPLADSNGAVVGVVSSKIMGAKVEGLGFAVPIADALSALGLRIGDTTDAKLLTETTSPEPSTEVLLYEDSADPVPSLDPRADRARARERAADEARAAERAAEADRDRRTPWVLPLMKWGGLALGTAGLLTATATYLSYNSTTTKEPEFHSLQAWNTAGWVAAGVGAGAFVLSFPLRPSLKSTKASTSFRVGPGAVAWEGTF